MRKKTADKQPRFHLKPACAAVLLAFTIQTIQANPLGPSVVNGQASFATSGNTLTVTNTPGAIINWQGFSIGANEITRFAQQSASSAVLNRVISNNPSSILGSLQSNGRVFLVNPNGIVFGQGATINVAGLVATSLNMSNADFIAGRYNFTEVPGAQNISNAGNLTAQSGGQIYLIAPNVENTGIINAPNGEILLAAGHSVELVDTTNPNLRVNITAPAGDATNVGQLVAEAGSLGLFGTVVRNTGLASADSATMQGGKIVFKASQRVETGGTISASGTGTPSPQPLSQEARGLGGSIDLSGASVAVGGTVSADGTRQGGVIAIAAGGVSLAGRISATGGNGQGGSIAIESQTANLNNVHATLDASGASGGSIREIAGHQITSSATYLATGSNGQGGKIDLSAPATKLLSAQIDASGATGGGQIRVGGEFQGGKSTSLNPFGVSLSNPLPNAETLAISAGSNIKADATQQGDGGTIILWSDLESALYADVSAQGKNGAGGFIELSSAEKLLWGGSANAGVGGKVLMDPKNIVIQDATAGGIQYNLTLGYNYINLPRMRGNDLAAGDFFGSAVSLSGTQLAVGARVDDGYGNLVTDSGAVYLFSNPYTAPTFSGIIGKGYTGAGNFNLTALEASDYFGRSVSLSGTQLAVGAPWDGGFGNAALYSGAVYLFSNPFSATPTLSGIIGKGYTGAGNFNLTALEASDQFGSSVSLSGTQLAVGVYGDGGFGNAATGSGAVYLFNTPYTAPALSGIIGKGYTGAGDFNLTALEAWDHFGTAVSLSGTQLAVGAISDAGSGNAATNSGAVYLFNTPYTTPALSGIIGKGYIGAGNFDLTALGAWDFFGSSVSLSGTQLAVGAYEDDGSGNAATDSGAVYLFNTPYTTPALSGIIGKGYIGAGDFNLTALEASDHFGSAVSLSGTQLAVGAQWDGGSGNLFTNSGAVYLFNAPFSTPTLSGIIGKGYSGVGNVDPGDALAAGDHFGSAVSLFGTQLAVGAMWDDGLGDAVSGSGAVYLFNDPYTTPTLSGIIGNGYTGAGNFNLTSLETDDRFGWSVSLSGTQLAVGAWWDDGFGNAVFNSGAVYLFNNPFGATALSGIIGKGYTGTGNFDVAALQSDDQFGSAVSLSGTQLAVGAWWDDSFNNVGLNEGAVYLFNNPFGATALSGIIGNGYVGAGNVNLTLQGNDLFGTSVSLMGAQLAVGASGDDGFTNTASSSGAVYLFNNLDTTPTLSGTIGQGYVGTGDFNLTALGGGGLDAFGSAVSLSGTQLAVGAAGDDGFGNLVGNSGAVYLLNNPFGATALSGIIGKGYTGTGDHNLSVLEANDRFGTAISLSGTQLAVGTDWDDGPNNLTSSSGAVYLFTLVAGGGDPATGQTFASNSALDSTITPASIAAILNTGSALTLQANNDITVTNAIIANNATGNGGTLTMQAGRSILVNANITTDNGNLALTANDTLANGVVTADRDVGAAQIAVASGVTLNAGTGSVNLQVLDGAGRTGAQATAGDITLSNAINAGAINLLSSSNIVLNGTASLTASGGNVLLNSDLDGVGGGAISMASGSSITSNGGNIALGGGTAGDGTGNATGNATYINGIYLTGATLDAGGGSIELNGTGFAGTSLANGIYVTGTSSIQTTGAGTITLDGTGGAGTSSNYGVSISGAGTSISSVDGGISILGQGAGTGDWTIGVAMLLGSSVTSTGTAPITISGTGGNAGSQWNLGVLFSGDSVNVPGPTVQSTDGDITIIGQGGASASSSYNYGMLLQWDATVRSTGTGKISLSGTGGAGASGNHGVYLAIPDTSVEAANGSISITGQGAGSGAFNNGIYITDDSYGARLGGPSIVSTGLASISLDGTGTTGSYGIAFDAGSVSGNTGNVLLKSGNDLSINGTIIANTLRLLGTGTFSLGGANNNVGILAANVTGDVTYNDTSGFAIGSVTSFDGTAVTTTTGMATTGSAIFYAGGAITTSGGVVTANSLNVTATGGIALTTQVTDLTTSNTGAGNTLINNTGALTVNGMSDASGSITLNNAGSMTLGGWISANGIALTASGTASDIIVSSYVESTNGMTINVGNDMLVEDTVTSVNGMMINVGGNLTLDDWASDVAELISNAGTQTVTVGGNLNLFGSGAYMYSASGQTINVVGGDLSSQNGGMIESAAATTLQVGNDLILSDGQIRSSGPLSGSIGRDVTITGGLSSWPGAGLFGTPDIGSAADPFTVGGVIRLDDVSGNYDAQIHSGSIASIWIHFPNLSSGGYFVNGTEGVVSSGSSGFYANGVPAVLDSNLHITYGLTAASGNILSFLPDLVNTVLIPGNGASGASQSTIGSGEEKKEPPPVVVVNGEVLPADSNVQALPVCPL